MIKKTPEKYFLFLMLFISGVLIFANLGNIYLWQDEACVAQLGKNVLKFGYPKLYDGKNVIIALPLAEFNAEYLSSYVTSQTWLEYYLVAASFSLFGINTFAARLPFALFGIAAVAVSYFLFSRIIRDKFVVRLATILLVFSVPFLLNVRQVSYSALVIFSVVWIFLSYIKLLAHERHAAASFVISNVFLFYSFFPLTFLIGIAILAHFILFRHYRDKAIMRSVTRIILAILLLISPAFFFLDLLLRVEMGRSRDLGALFLKFKANWLWINNYIFPFLILLLLTVKSIFSRRTGVSRVFFSLLATAAFLSAFYFLTSPGINLSRSVLLLIAVCACVAAVFWGRPDTDIFAYLKKNEFLVLFLIFILALIVSVSLSSDAPYFRYIVSVIPMFALITAAAIYHLCGKNWLLSGFLAGLLVFSNCLSIFPLRVLNSVSPIKDRSVFLFSEGIHRDLSRDRYKSDILNYFYEITHDYECTVEGVAKYLNRHGSPDDVVKISYNDIPAMFYTDLRIVSWRDPGGEAPDWMVPITSVPFLTDEKFLKNIEGVQYEKIVTDYPNICYSNLPEPLYHNFRTVGKTAMPIYFIFRDTKEVPRLIFYKKIKR